MAETAVQVLGSFKVESDHREVGLDHPAERMVAFLAVWGRRVGRHMISAQLYPDHAERAAAARLRQALWQLRQAVPALVDADRRMVGLGAGVSVDLDLARSAIRVLQAGGHLNMTRPQLIDLFSHDLLEDFDDEWLVPHQRHYRQMRLRALECVAERSLDAGDHWLAAEAASAILMVEPIRDTANVLMARIYRSEGNPSLATEYLEGYSRKVDAPASVRSTPR